MKTLIISLILISFIFSKPLPVVLWHGMGDSCCSSGMSNLIKLIQEHTNGTYVHSIMIGNSEMEDRTNSFIGNANVYIADVCKKLAADPNLRGGFNAIGISQGSQFLRAYVQRCNRPPVRNLISIGGQHQGVYGLPNCGGENSTLCDWVRRALAMGAYISFVQNRVIQAQYWHDPTNVDSFINNCIFLPDINNLKPQKNETYKMNLMSLNKFVMVKFLKDSMVQPRESMWFGFYKYGTRDVVLRLNETELYQKDWLGLQQMDKEGKLEFLSVDAEHLRFSREWFIQKIIPYLL